MDDAEWQAYAWAEYNGEPWQVDDFQSALMAALLEPIEDCYEVVTGNGEVVARYCL